MFAVRCGRLGLSERIKRNKWSGISGRFRMVMGKKGCRRTKNVSR